MTGFGKTIAEAYAVEGAAIDLGRGVHEGTLTPEAVVQVPLSMMNRHGLIAGATGTGKTRTLQLLAEGLSANGVPVVVADVKGDLTPAQDKPQLWSTVLMWLVAELFETLPEAGDLPKPKLVVFLDEAHLLFDDATEAFLDALERTVRLIRSKGVGVFFVTQQPTDLSEAVLAQLGLRIQHALRAFTPSDAKKLRATVSTYPESELYDVETLLTSVGIGEAAVTLLSERGVPTPVVHARMLAPVSRMDPADDV